MEETKTPQEAVPAPKNTVIDPTQLNIPTPEGIAAAVWSALAQALSPSRFVPLPEMITARYENEERSCVLQLMDLDIGIREFDIHLKDALKRNDKAVVSQITDRIANLKKDKKNWEVRLEVIRASRSSSLSKDLLV